MPTYTPADDDTMRLLLDVQREYHPVLAEIGLTIGVLMANGSTDAEGNIRPAVKHGGYPCAAKIRIVGLKDRALGMPDVEVIIDGDTWGLRSLQEKRAIIDHELTHIDLKIGDDGKHVVDDLGRPKLRMRLHDYQIGGFHENVDRHGKHSIEHQALAALFDEKGQAYFPFLQRVEQEVEA